MRKLGRLRKLRQWSFVRRRTPNYPLSHKRALLLKSIYGIFGAIAKALELFLAMIVEEASKVTVERGAKKVEGYHLCVHCYLNHDLVMNTYAQKACDRNNRDVGFPKGNR
jgi:hypothetical protein